MTALATRAATTRMDEELQGAAPEEALRANTYSLVATLLAQPPTQEVLALLSGIPKLTNGDESGMAAAWQALRLSGERTSVEALDDEFHDLFIGVGRGELVPYGSWYMTGFMLDQPLALLRRDLASLGIERREDVRDPEDHVAALCETMSIIINSGDEIAVDTQRRFFQDHLSQWLGKFFVDMQQAKSARFYRAVGHFGEQFFELEKRYLAMLA